ncbi:MAG: glycosyltransferase [Proteobacteria bacterium]|jgi:glycosyltransferase involved in cell wall biosynthesis|nr:glycosyltransferase [Pseudomonadota bacterium]
MLKKVLWWGRFDEDYSRNRILKSAFNAIGYDVIPFIPLISGLGFIEALFRLKIIPDLIFVPCFRQRDIKSAYKWSRKINKPLIIDPLISQWDKQINERNKLPFNSSKAKLLKNKEKYLLNLADLIFADTQMHANFFHLEFSIPKPKLSVVYVGAEEKIFNYKKINIEEKTKVLFYGSFIKLHGAEVIIKAAKLLENENIEWNLIGQGPYLEKCKKLAKGYEKIKFFSAIPYKNLPNHIFKSDIMLGIFGSSRKAENVIPNKVFQSLACGRLVITRKSNAYPKKIKSNNGIIFINPNDPNELAKKVLFLSQNKKEIISYGNQARKIFMHFFSQRKINLQLKKSIKKII